MNLLDTSTRNVISVSPESSIDQAIALMEEFEIHHLPVMIGDAPVGMVSDRDILLAVGWRHTSERRLGGRGSQAVAGPSRVEQIMSRPVVAVDPDQPIGVAVRRMLERGIHALPIVGRGRVLGVLAETDVLVRVLAQRSADVVELLECPVRGVLRPNVITISPSASLIDIVELFQRRHIQHVPVLANHKLVGIISDRDVRRAMGTSAVGDMQAQDSGIYFDDRPSAADIMSRSLHTVQPTTIIGEAIPALLDHRIHALPVVERERLVGIVTQTDFIREVMRREIL